MPFAAAHSVHPAPVHAIGELTGQILEQLDDEAPDVALLFVTGHHAGALAECGVVVRNILRPATLLGGTFSSVLARGHQADTAAMTLWAGRFGEVHPLGFRGIGDMSEPSFVPGAALVLADPFGLPIGSMLAGIEQRWPGLAVVGGLVSAGRGPRCNRLLLDDSLLDRGAVGVLLGPGLAVEAVLSQGSRPVGRPYVVTAGGEGLLRELDGQLATLRLRQLIEDELREDEAVGAHRGGLDLGRTLPEGGVLVRPTLGLDRMAGTIAVDDAVVIGSTVQFHLRSPEAAEDDLRAALNGRWAESALVFPHADRSALSLADPSRDAIVIDDYLGRIAVAGASCAGVFGPVGGVNFSHHAGVAMALLRQT